MGTRGLDGVGRLSQVEGKGRHGKKSTREKIEIKNKEYPKLNELEVSE